VASNRVDVKQAAARAERALERLAEPLSALFLPADHWPAALLDEAWLEVIRNSAHDSICACSVDEVCDAVLHRFAEATQIADGLTERALHALGATVAVDGRTPVIVNPSARTRCGMVELRLRGADVPAGTQLVSQRLAEWNMVEDTAIEVATVMVAELEYVRNVESFTVLSPDGTELIRVVREPAGTLVTPPIRQQLADLRSERAGEQVTVRVTTPPAITVLAHVADVPGYGWQAWTGASAPVEPVTATELGLANGILSVEVDPSDGTFAIDGHGGLGRLVDGGDVGDTYNWCPPDRDVLVDTPTSVSTRVVDAGPVRARLQVIRTYAFPTHAADGTRAGEQPVDVLTTLELRAGEDLVRVHVELDNHGLRDHRLRAVFPLPERATASVAECAFATVERGLVAEGGPTERGLATYPSRRFVTAGGLTLAHEGLLEYELVDLDADATSAGALALTLVRSTGMLSQGPMATRPLPAGPLTPMEGPQSQHRVHADFAVHLGARNPYEVADELSVPLQVTRGGGPSAGGPATGQALSITGAEVSAIVREAGQLLVRVFNPSAQPATVTIDGRDGWLVDLRGRSMQPFEGSFDLTPWQIVTVNLGD
jgi:hypothetical protein